MNSKEIKRILKECQDKKDIYIDCYDTIIHRKYSINYAFLILAEYLKQEFDFDETLKQIEMSLNHIFYKCDFSFERHVKDVYLHYKKNINISFDAFYKEFKTIFIDAEIDNSIVDKGAIVLLKKLKEQNKRIFLLSDFFIGKEFIEKLFEKLGILDLFDDIYVSSDLKMTKSDGNIYSTIEDKKNSFMIGDNKKSDFIIPNSLGIQSYLIDAYKFKKIIIDLDDSYTKFCNKRFKEFVNNKKGEFAVNYKFLFFAFCKGLYSKLQHDDVVYFLARDGKFLKDCFDIYLNNHNLKNIKTRYLPVSRIATMIASIDIDSMDFKEFASIFKGHTNWEINSTTKFLESLGISNINLSNNFNDSNKDISHKRDTDYFDSTEFQNLFENKEFKTVFKERQKIAKTKFLSLVKEKNNNRLITVDMGWCGTSQNDMRLLLPDDIKLFGYYVGTLYCIGEMENSYKYGILFDYYNDSKFKSNYMELEGVLKSDQKQLLCYGENDDFYLSDNGLEV